MGRDAEVNFLAIVLLIKSLRVMFKKSIVKKEYFFIYLRRGCAAELFNHPR